jgi:hypothetical protein
MDCPKCHQSTSVGLGSMVCPLCGFDLGPVQQRLRVLYAIGSAIFASVLVYGGLVWFMEQQAGFRPPSRPLAPALPYALLAVSVVVFGIAVHVLRKRVAEADSGDALHTLTIIRLALAESIAIYGLVLYLVGRSLEWFVTLLGLSLLAFALIAAQMPQVARRMGELMVKEQSDARG